MRKAASFSQSDCGHAQSAGQESGRFELRKQWTQEGQDLAVTTERKKKYSSAGTASLEIQASGVGGYKG